MVEMVEAANILHHATNRSLLILDEIAVGEVPEAPLSKSDKILQWDPTLGVRVRK